MLDLFDRSRRTVRLFWLILEPFCLGGDFLHVPANTVEVKQAPMNFFTRRVTL
jgi:hypothetical protein